jgi:hypothetical protein
MKLIKIHCKHICKSHSEPLVQLIYANKSVKKDNSLSAQVNTLDIQQSGCTLLFI